MMKKGLTQKIIERSEGEQYGDLVASILQGERIPGPGAW